MEREFGERALNGDKSQAAMLQAKIDELERKLETQRAAENSTADSKPRSDVGSENETDSDVSTLLYLPSNISQSVVKDKNFTQS